MTTLALIAAVAKNGVIGNNNQLPWHLPADLQYFKETTLHHTILMGRKTFGSIGKPLPKRRNLVITRDMTWQHEGCEVFHSIAEALTSCSLDEKVFVIGGEELFKQTFPLAAELYLTEIKKDFPGDVFFPGYDKVAWKEMHRLCHQAGEIAFDFVVYEKIA